MTKRMEDNDSFKAGLINEGNTRRILIDSQLIKAHWNLRSQVKQEYAIEVVENGERTIKFIDYVLLDNKGDPLAIVEAKKWSRDPYEGKKQAEEYMNYLKITTNRDCFIFLSNGEDILFWDRHIYPPRTDMGFCKGNKKR